VRLCAKLAIPRKAFLDGDVWFLVPVSPMRGAHSAYLTCHVWTRLGNAWPSESPLPAGSLVGIRGRDHLIGLAEQHLGFLVVGPLVGLDDPA